MFADLTAAISTQTGLAGLSVVAVPVAAAMAVSARRARRAEQSAHDELRRLVGHDAITDLPTRSRLSEWLDSEARGRGRQQRATALVLIDLHRLRQVNDMFGREVGDKLIRAVADRIRSVLDTGDRIARFGGDEFVLVCQGLADSAALATHAGRLIRLVEQPYSIGGQTLRLAASAGAVWSEDPRAAADEILRQADVARHRAHRQGPGTVTVYEPAMSSALSPTNAEAMVDEAMRTGAFRLNYQPVVNLTSGRVVGAEALLRWIEPDGRVMKPDEFIPILEETGLIVPVGTWVLREACQQAARLRDLLGGEVPPTVTINVSARQLAADDFASLVADALRSSGVAEHQIHLEITEGALMHDVGSAWTVLRQAKALGVKLALDDFGTGYSSLSYVRRFSLDMLKIDKSFIDGIDSSIEDRAIVQHVIGLADALGMTTVAEGVERPEQLMWLRRLGCQMAQGYALSRPLSAEDLETLMVRRADDPFLFEVDPTPLPPAIDLTNLTGRTQAPSLDLFGSLDPTVPGRPSSSPAPGPTARPYGWTHPPRSNEPPMVFSEPEATPGDASSPHPESAPAHRDDPVPPPDDPPSVDADDAPRVRLGLPRFREYRLGPNESRDDRSDPDDI